jgi:hypothetical protein
VNPTKLQSVDEGCRHSYSSVGTLTERLSSTLLLGLGSGVFEGYGQHLWAVPPSQRQRVDVSLRTRMTASLRVVLICRWEEGSAIHNVLLPI